MKIKVHFFKIKALAGLSCALVPTFIVSVAARP